MRYSQQRAVFTRCRLRDLNVREPLSTTQWNADGTVDSTHYLLHWQRPATSRDIPGNKPETTIADPHVIQLLIRSQHLGCFSQMGSGGCARSRRPKTSSTGCAIPLGIPPEGGVRVTRCVLTQPVQRPPSLGMFSSLGKRQDSSANSHVRCDPSIALPLPSLTSFSRHPGHRISERKPCTRLRS